VDLGIFLFAIGVMAGLAVPLLRSLPQRLPVWHHQLWKRYWRHKSRSHGGRPQIDPKLIANIRRLNVENPIWGAPRIHAELLKLGWSVAQSTVSKYMLPRSARPGAGWCSFIANHRINTVAIDMACVRTASFGCLYAFVVLDIRSRLLVHIEVTDHPTAIWLSREIAYALPPGGRPTYLIRDNVRAYGAAFRRELLDMGVIDRPIRPYSPWQNGHVERVIGSMRRECLDHIIILNAQHLRRILLEYKDYYNQDRTHLSLGKDTPIHRPIERSGKLKSRKILGGLHHRYYRDERE
jgi:putative transposase